ncbi:MAG: EAL domain-containing protein [Xanthomonadales bacterium]|nr:EAL domain-containing protein [Xanthomonadales bacterium]
MLILYADPEDSDAPLIEIGALAESCSVPLALFTSLDAPEKLAAALNQTACHVINADNENLLVSAVNRLAKSKQNERRHERQNQRLQELEHRYNLLLDSSREAIAYVHEGLHVYTNRAYREALNVRDESEIAGLSLLDILKAGDTDLKSTFRALSKGQFPTEPLAVTVQRQDGGEFDARLIFLPARFDGEDCIQMMVQRSDTATHLATELERLRLIDPLTRLMNRNALFEELETSIAAGPCDGAAAILYIEPDGFEELRDELDADATDKFISDLAAIIKGALRDTDKIARIADEAFAALVYRNDSGALENAAREILEAYRGHVIEFGDRALSGTCSIGLASIGRLSRNATHIMANARKAHREAAQQGDQLVAHRPQLTAVSSNDDDQQWVRRINYAIGNDDFYSVQQSIVDLDGEGQHLIENMTYMREETGDRAPVDYANVADRNDLAGRIDRHVIPGLLKSFVENNDRQIISISNNSVLDYGFPAWLAEQFNTYCVEGDRVVLQIPAVAALSNLKPAQRLMKELQPLGSRLAISSFDASRRSLQLLEHLGVSYIKLDPKLTRELTSSSKNQEDVRKITEAAQQRGVCVIADEVSDTASLATLWQCGVKLVAGTFLKEQSQVIAQ